MFESTVVKVAPDQWMKVMHKSKVREYFTNWSVEMLFTAEWMTLVHDSGKVRG